MIVASGARLALDYTGTDTIDELWLGGVQKSPGVYSSANSGTFITGPGTLTVTKGPPSDYDQWKAANNLTGGPGDDDDHDGLTNFAEYAFGLDPRNGGSVQPVTVMPIAPTGAFTYSRRKQALTGLAFAVWTSRDLAEWTVNGGAVQSVTATTGDSETVLVTPTPSLQGGQCLFVRLSAGPP